MPKLIGVKLARQTEWLDGSQRRDPESGQHPHRKGGTGAVVEYFGEALSL